MGLGAMLYQEQDGANWVIGYARWALSKSESHYLAHELEFLVLKWAVTKSFQVYLYGNTFMVYSDNNPLTYVLTTGKLDATKLAKFNFTIHHHLEKFTINADVLSQNPVGS